LYAVTPSASERVVVRDPINLLLHDISRNGTVLNELYRFSVPIIGVHQTNQRSEIFRGSTP